MRRMPSARPLPLACVAVAAVWVGLGMPARAAANDSSCVEASAAAAEAMRVGQWQKAADIWRSSIRRPECAGVATEQMYSLAYSTEQMVPDDPSRACEAEKLYLAVLERNPEPQFTEGARKGSRRMMALCNRCRSAQEASAKGDWARAERQLRTDLGLKSCEREGPRLRFELAEVVEQLVVDQPSRACEARTLYQRAAEAAAGKRDRMRATAGAARMKLLCDRRPAAPEAGDGGAEPTGVDGTTPPPAPAEPDRTAAVWTTVAAGVAVAAGGAMIYGSVLQESAWEDALTDREAAHARGDAEAVAAAEARFEDAASLGPTLNIAGWSAIGVGAALGALASWMWIDTPDVEATIGPGGAGVMVRF